MVTLFITSLLLGLVFNAAPGAVFAETVRQGLRGGFRPALAVQVGSLVGDALWAVVGLVGVGMLLQLDVLRVPVGVAGVLYLLWLSIDSWKAAGREFLLGSGSAVASSREALRAGVTLSITNPQNIAYCAALGSAIGSLVGGQPQAADYAMFFSGLMLASVLWSFVCAGAVALVFHRAGARWAAVTYRLCAAAFLLLALSALRDLLQPTSGPTAAYERPAAHGQP
jgi:chemosensory pili system protein ChpE